ncbi:MAG: serine/threonine-protein kinase [Planctomycetota bacterium]
MTDSPTIPAAEGGKSGESGRGVVPTQIGAFRVLGTIGEGGFGVVYEAEQTEPVRRRVALKVIKPGMDSAAVVARFEAERQALAVMDHPCIATIIDGGMTGPELGSRPYFVMELIRGVPITEHCDAQRLTIDERCELFIKVCEAVQHAHTKGVVHRDLKPSNVLVAYDADGKAIPKIIDFGVAKALNTRLTEKTIFTERGQLIGTPEYMSPEQAEMSGQDIDTRADVYSLGVLLYELLTGVLPFDPKTLREAAFAEIQRIIREIDPPKPSTKFSTMLHSGEAADRVKQIIKARKADAKAITGVLKRDLDWVIMRSLEKDRDRRYQTATELGDELGRYLADEPVEAGPPSVMYRLSKSIRRNRSAFLVSALVALLLVAGSAGTMVGLARALAAERDVRASRQDLSGLMHDVIHSLVGIDAERRTDTETIDETIDLLVSSDISDRFAKTSDSDDDYLRASALYWTGLALLRRGNPALAQDYLRRSVAVFQPAGPADVSRLDAEMALIEAYFRNGEDENARRLTNSVVERLGTTADVPIGVQLDWRENAAGVLKRLGQHDGSVRLYRDVLTQRTSMEQDDASIAGTMYNLALALETAGQRDRAIAMMTEAMRLRLASDQVPPEHLMNAIAELAFLHKKNAANKDDAWSNVELDKAERLYEDAMAVGSGMLPRNHVRVLMTEFNLGRLYWDQGKVNEGYRLMSRMHTGARETLGIDHPLTIQSFEIIAKKTEQTPFRSAAVELGMEAQAAFHYRHPERELPEWVKMLGEQN